MGLFDKLKKAQSSTETPVQQKAKVEPDCYYEKGGYKFHFPVNEEEKTSGWSVSVNLSDKNLKNEIADQAYIKNVYLWHEDGLIRCLEGERVVFEVTNRNKAYEELLPYAKRTAKSVTVTKRNGSYGVYYSTNIKFEVVIDDSGMQYT